MSFRKTFASATTALALILAAQTASAESLGGALAAAYNNSGLLEKNRAVLRAADEDVAQAVAALRPTITWAIKSTSTWVPNPSAGQDWSDPTVEGTLRLTQSLFDSGIGRMTVEAKKEAVLASRQALLSVEQEVLIDAISAYLDVRSTAEFTSLRESNVRVLTQELRAAQDRFDVGEVTRTDVSLAEAALASARSLLAVAQGNQVNARETYRVAVGQVPTSLDAAPVARLPMDQASAVAYALQNHPSIVQLQHTVRALELAADMSNRATRPTLDLTALTGADEDLNYAGQVELSLSGPIYSGGLIASRQRAAQADLSEYRAALHQASLSVEQAVISAYAQYQVAVAASEAYQQQVNAAQLAFDGVREEANAGSRTTIDVLNAEQDLLDARANLVDAQSTVVLASYAVLSTMGLLTAESLNLDVTLYDVEAYYNLVAKAPVALSPQGAALDRILGQQD